MNYIKVTILAAILFLGIRGQAQALTLDPEGRVTQDLVALNRLPMIVSPRFVFRIFYTDGKVEYRSSGEKPLEAEINEQSRDICRYFGFYDVLSSETQWLVADANQAFLTQWFDNEMIEITGAPILIRSNRSLRSAERLVFSSLTCQGTVRGLELYQMSQALHDLKNSHDFVPLGVALAQFATQNELTQPGQALQEFARVALYNRQALDESIRGGYSLGPVDFPLAENVAADRFY